MEKMVPLRFGCTSWKPNLAECPKPTHSPCTITHTILCPSSRIGLLLVPCPSIAQERIEAAESLLLSARARASDFILESFLRETPSLLHPLYAPTLQIPFAVHSCSLTAWTMTWCPNPLDVVPCWQLRPLFSRPPPGNALRKNFAPTPTPHPPRHPLKSITRSIPLERRATSEIRRLHIRRDTPALSTSLVRPLRWLSSILFPISSPH